MKKKFSNWFKNKPLVTKLLLINVMTTFVAALILMSLVGAIYSNLHPSPVDFIMLISAATLFAACISISIANQLQKMLMKPMYKLIRSMHHVFEKSDYSHQLKIDSDDEIGELARGYNQIMSKVHFRERVLDRELKNKVASEKKLDKLAYYDVTTHLPNRHYFNHSLTRIVSKLGTEKVNFGLMFIDLDNFKMVNDTYGHHMGDALLLKVAEILKSSVRTEDVVTRLGGDEFAIILNNLSRTEDAANIAHKINQQITATKSLEGNEIAVGASIGISMFPQDADNVDSLLQNADTAMYYAKEMCRNNFQFFNAAMRASTHQRLAVEANLRKALENNEFFLEYQPQFNINTQQIVGAEALIRWNHPELGRVKPDDFITIAEESGLIVPIGEWVFATACKQAKKWRSEGLAITVAVNISGRQFRAKNLVERLSQIIEETGAQPEWLELELTESSLLDNSEIVTKRLQDLTQKGFRLTIDDFGTGYSSLAHFKRFAISKIKIDRSFITDIEKNNESNATARAIIALGSSLNMQVIAEGIETKAQADYLLACDCNLGQGFLVSPAVHPDKITLMCDKKPCQPTSTSQ